MLIDRAREREPEFLDLLAELVAIDSPSDEPELVNAVAERCQQRFGDAGWEAARVRLEPRPDGARSGDAVVARVPGRGGRRVLLLAHMDTVFPVGTAAARPFRVQGDRAFGPGVADDKNGIAAGLHAVELLRASGNDTFGEVVLVLTSDEESGSPASRHLIERLAYDVDVALCLESGRAGGAVVSARKGVTDVVIEITGRAAHAGVEPEKGVNAALEAAHQVVAIQALNGRWDGVTCNVGVLHAGGRTNVVPERARLEVDLRAWDVDSFREAAHAIEGIASRSHVEGATATVRRGAEFPPMPKTAATERLLATARAVAGDLGLDLADVATGGGADANLVAAQGVPTLDGLAPVGGAAHTADEWLDLTSVAPRLALLAGLIGRLGSKASADGTEPV